MTPTPTNSWTNLTESLPMTQSACLCDATLLRGVMRSADIGGDTLPRRVLLAPWGEVESTNGNFLVDDQAADLTVTAFRDHGTDLPIDYEHQTLGGAYASPSGQAPAAGWIKNLDAEPALGIFAEIEWTEAARRLIADRQYRYLSPVAIIRRADRRLVALHSAALTNKPAIIGMQPIVNRDGDAGNSDNTLAQICAMEETPGRIIPRDDALDPDRTETPDDEETDTNGPDEFDGDESGTDSRTSFARLCAMLQLPESTPAHDVLAAAGRRLAFLDERTRREHVRRRVGEAICAGKLVEAQRAWAEALVAKEEGLFDEWLRTAPVVVVPGRIRPPANEDAHTSRRHAVARRATSEFRACPALARITCEEAFVADALRETLPSR